ncbi:peptide chain release factor N(5)-glutamine methyltransferase [Prochlorococcus sp.]|jgi:release factor glutamine methyltransferase|uniref:peptide chain release factor N(5)-glutamine methyltransferase n=1 Tax=Prochlorococcus sp. TaxID=1220 RepID=UPI000E000960|nr:MAG: peptide chain release factor N(5)-glutamine methyltransferase [Prochlorococcus sp. MED-G72]|tara:strand:- start:806 stop:1675 length:870 start_codon:yes stop_codon:yes gene_type:complete
MFLISAEKFSLWKKKQISKGGDNHSLNLLIDSLGGLSNIELNLLKIKSEKVLNLNLDLDFIETLWDKHLNTSIPIQYLSGISFWRDLKLEVSNKILIPRPETELFIDIVSGIFKNKKEKITFVDLGTGSGAISIALALANPNWSGIATDIDKSAIEIASRNFKTNSNQSNLKFYNGNWWDPLENFKGEIDFAVANPPYIPQDTYEVLPIEVKNFEPKLALLGGKEGLDHINQIVQNAPLYLKNKGWLLIENHFDQGEKVKKLFLENRFTSVKVLKDFSGIGRFTIGRYK